MRNFNNIRTVNLTEYLPPVLKDITEMRAIMDSETPEIQAIWNACEDCMNDQFILESTEKGIARRERMLNITPTATDSLDDRRFRLFTRYNERTPYTQRSLTALLEALCGTNGYALSISGFTVDVKVALTIREQERYVRELLERILPYNIEFTVGLLYNQHGMYTKQTNAELTQYTHDELRNEVF